MTVLNLPLPPRTCFKCQHYMDLAGGGYCEVYEESIDSEVAAAKDCDWYHAEGLGRPPVWHPETSS